MAAAAVPAANACSAAVDDARSAKQIVAAAAVIVDTPAASDAQLSGPTCRTTRNHTAEDATMLAQAAVAADTSRAMSVPPHTLQLGFLVVAAAIAGALKTGGGPCRRCGP
ncbi:hypothetical protein JKP88DRAFT_246114 [Tribonema minus]|uniref:Uncharacterized protein n=1 Tax=Tribonema minus TaxID=303371 RepID=A0A835YYF8_9STRA|nr:hypothetical protein JKP88DRAFT_246114 [Tribonema minus]